MKRNDYDKQLLRWVKNHYWDSLEKDKDLILRHLRTFAGNEHAPHPIIEEIYYTLRHARIFIASREKMNPTGVKIYDELLQKIKEGIYE